MSSSNDFRLRWKGTVTGPFSLSRISEMLRSGEISLLHNIEVDGNWQTLRDYFRANGINPSPAPSAYTSDAPPSPPGARGINLGSEIKEPRNGNAEALERFVLEGYFWCGATFLMPPVLGLLVGLWVKLHEWTSFIPETPPLSQFVLLCFTTFVGGLLPIYFVRKLGRLLDGNGLTEIRQGQEKLVYFLASLGISIWLVFFWFMTRPKP
jgi:hypothetical protein